MQFQEGNIPWNKGIKTGLIPKTAFKEGHKKGQKPQVIYSNWRPSFGMLGKKHSEETKRRIRQNHKGGARKKQNLLENETYKKYQNRIQRERYWNDAEFKRRCNNYNRVRRGFGKLTLEEIQLVYEDNIKKYNRLTCYLCLKPIKFGQDSLEHKIPLCRGGTNLYENLAIAHKSCNSKKRSKTEKEYREFLNAKKS